MPGKWIPQNYIAFWFSKDIYLQSVLQCKYRNAICNKPKLEARMTMWYKNCLTSLISHNDVPKLS